jgi:hypothetical protein
MIYSASRTNLEDIVRWLRGQDESQWENQIGLLAATIYDLREMADPITRRDETGSRSLEPDLIPVEAVRITAAMPHLGGMLDAMRRRNRETALEYCQASLALLLVD